MIARESVSLVVPVGADRRHLTRHLESLTGLDPAPLEIVLVLDGGGPLPDDLPAPPSLQVLSSPAPRGPAAARNLGARAAVGDVVLFVDADVVVPSDLAGRVVDLLGGDPSLAAVIGSYDAAPADPSFLSRYRNLLHHFVHQSSSPEASTFWGACGAIRRQALSDVGGFDETFRTPSIEDIELGYRLTDRGGRIRLEAGLQVKHLKRWTLPEMLVTDFARRGIPWSRLLLRRGRARADLNLRWSDRLAVALVWGAALLLLAGSFLAALPLLAGATILDARLHGFFLRAEGPLFTAGAVPLRWLFHFYSGAAFIVALAQHLVAAVRPRVGPSVRALSETEAQRP